MTTELVKPDKTPDGQALIKQPLEIGECGFALKTLDDAYRFAHYVIASKLAPTHYQKPEQVIIAVQWGYELGMGPMQALHSIAIINNRPALWGDALPALVWKSGKCAHIHEFIEGSGDSMVAVCQTRRVGQENIKETRFNVDDAKKAGLWTKQGTWQNYPKRMLQMRARAFNFRDQFADALRGMSVAEEVQDIPATPTSGRTLTLQDAPAEIEGETVAAETDTEPDFDDLMERLGGCNTPGMVQDVAAMHPSHDEWQRMCGLRIKEMLKNGNDLFAKG